MGEEGTLTLEEFNPGSDRALEEIAKAVAAIIENDFDEEGYLTAQTRDFRIFSVDINLGNLEKLTRTIPATAQMIQVRSTRDVAGGQEITLVFMESALSEAEQKSYADNKAWMTLSQPQEATEVAEEEDEDDE